MPKNIYLCILILVFLVAAVNSADLYRVRVSSDRDAAVLTNARVEPIIRLNEGYLIIAEPQIARDLASAKIAIEPVAANIEKQNLAVDLRLDRRNAQLFDLIFEQEGIRLYRVDESMEKTEFESLSLMPIRNDFLNIEYLPQKTLDYSTTSRGIGLQELIDMVSQDSLESYSEALQAYGPRPTGSATNYTTRDWIAAKFDEIGYDSIVIDSFIAASTNCMNVIAYKIGTHLPEHHVIIGAHRDAVPGSPGADDNGSGTVAVLEMARILRNIDTDLSFVFILFDAEEDGLHGAYHYANEAFARGDSIVYMLNLDMIAHYENSNQAKLYHGTDQSYSLLWQDLAAPLVGINGVLSGNSGGSDHYPFSQLGYTVTFVHEYIFSSVYHSYQDSTTYMDFDYMTRMVQASLATAYTVDQDYIPGPALTFGYPDDIPDALTPNQPTPFEVVVTGFYGGVPVPASGQIHYSVNGGATQSDAMTQLTDIRYQAMLPPLSCGDFITFYVSAEEQTEGIFYDPDPIQPHTAFPVTTDSIIFSDDFESDQGWSVSGGLWQRGSPSGGGGEYGGPDPVGGYNSSSVYGYNLSGDYTNNMPEYHLTSPAIDCSGLFGSTLSFWRWLGVEQPVYDHAYVRVSNDGINWTTIWENTIEVTDYDWVQQEYDISSIADNQSTVYLRWTMGTSDGGWVYCGWNIDDVQVRAFTCDQEPGPLEITTESLPDWTAGYPIAEPLAATGGVGQYAWTDKYGDLIGTGLTLSSGGVLSGTATTAGVVSFTAEVVDQEEGVDEKLLAITINDFLTITGTSLPSVVVGSPYSQQLTASGGTGNKSWTDRDGDLSGTGLAMDSDGAITGTPLSIGTIEFTAMVEDAVGCTDETLLSVDVLAPYICGDANDDGDVNVADAVYIINFVFKGGPAPDPPCVGDANGDDDVNVGDAVYLIAFVFSGGPPPVEGCCQ
jgi:hypothetical protein